MAKLSESATVDVKPILTGQATPGSGVVKADDQLAVTKDTLKLILSEMLQEIKTELRAEMQSTKSIVNSSNSAPHSNMVSELTPPAPVLCSDATPRLPLTSSIVLATPSSDLSPHASALPLPIEIPANIYKEEEDLGKWETLKIKATQGSKNPVFTGDHWLGWKRTALLDLAQSRLLDAIHNEPPSLVSTLQDAKQLAADRIVQGYMYQRLSPAILKDVANCKSAKAIWNKLVSHYENATTATKNKMQDKWNSLSQQPGQTMHNFIREIEYMILQMTNIGMDLTEQTKLHRLLTGMSSTWGEQKNFISMSEFSYERACIMLTSMSIDKGETADLFPKDSQANLARHPRPAMPHGSPTLRYCETCGKEDHSASSCPTGKPHKDSSGRNIKYCWNCSQPGHTHRQCTYGMSSNSN